jgi:hypothetical protein
MSATAQIRRRARGDRGAVIVFFGLFLVALLVITAIVVDLGMDRATIRNLKLDTDAAAIAAGFFLAGNGSATAVPNPQLACGAAIQSIRHNVPDFPSTAAFSSACSSLPPDALACTDSTPMSSLTSIGAEPYVLTIDYPVPASSIVDLARTGGEGTNDGISCKRMKVTLARTNTAAFGGIVGRTSSLIRQSSVVKAGLSDQFDVPAVLLLERSDCGVLQASGQGGVRVKATGASSGWIHVDTAAGGSGSVSSNCSGGSSCNANNFSIVGTQLPNSVTPLPELAPENPSIVVGNGTDGSAGIIGTYALNPGANGKGACTYPSGLSNPATASPLVGRSPVDRKYNNAAKPYGTNIATLHSTAYAAVTSPAPAGYSVVSGGACAKDDVIYAAGNVYVNCPSGFTGKNVVFRGSNFIFTGDLEVAGGYVAFPNAKTLFIRGCSGGSCTDAIGVTSGGNLSINSGEQTLTASLDAGTVPATWPAVDCLTKRNGAGSGGSTTNWTQVATFSGQFYVQNATGTFCQTSFYLGDNKPSYAAYSATTGGNCSVAVPCPAPAPPTAPVFRLNSGSNVAINWTAPNQNANGPSTASPFDALSLWTEGGTACSVGGQGAMKTTGVLFFPNCNFTYAGQADTNNPLNAQFIGRSLSMSGQGVLVLQPEPRVSVTVPVPGSVELIR